VGRDIHVASLFGSRARGEHRPDSDADLALILRERGNDGQTLWLLAGIAWNVFLDTGIMIQPVPIAIEDWQHPDDFLRPGFLRTVAREGMRAFDLELSSLATGYENNDPDHDDKVSETPHGEPQPMSFEEERRQARENWLRLRQQTLERDASRAAANDQDHSLDIELDD
jgi:hypothetical protein